LVKPVRTSLIGDPKKGRYQSGLPYVEPGGKSGGQRPASARIDAQKHGGAVTYWSP